MYLVYIFIFLEPECVNIVIPSLTNLIRRISVQQRVPVEFIGTAFDLLLTTYNNSIKPYPSELLNSVEPLTKILLNCNDFGVMQIGINCMQAIVQNTGNALPHSVIELFLSILNRELGLNRDEESCLYIGECLYSIQFNYKFDNTLKNDIIKRVIAKLLMYN